MTLKKRYSLPANVIEHIFEGELSGNSFSGFHAETRKNLTNGKFIITQIAGDQQIRRQSNQPYKANVKIAINGTMKGPEMKSIFPKDWNEKDIIRWMEQSLTDPTDSTRSSREAWTENARALRGTGTKGQSLTRIRINKVSCVVLYEGGKIASIYPNII